MAAIFLLLTVATFFWAAVKYFQATSELADLMPPELRDSPYALPEVAARPSTPLALQASYVESQIAGCVAIFFLSLLVFSLDDEAVHGWVFVAIFLLGDSEAVSM
jgi:hypothetical protein